MISVNNLTLRVGSFALNRVNFSIADGESFVLLGPSGAGKTLLIETIMGLRGPDSGEVLLDNRDITQLPPEIRKISYVPQDLGLFPHLSVRQNILFGPRVQNLAVEETNDSLEHLITLLNLQTFIDRKNIALLSGGEKQRVALARALIVKPRVLFLDEPFVSLDLRLRRELQLQFRALQKSLGINFIYVTHDQDEPYILGDKMGILIDGNLMQTGTIEEVYSQPASVEVAEFLMMQNIFRVTIIKAERAESYTVCSVTDGTGELLLTTDPSMGNSKAGQKIILGIWPKHVILRRFVSDWQTHGECSEKHNTYKAIVTGLIKYRSHYQVQTRITTNGRDIKISPGQDHNNWEVVAFVSEETYCLLSEVEVGGPVLLELPVAYLVHIKEP